MDLTLMLKLNLPFDGAKRGYAVGLQKHWARWLSHTTALTRTPTPNSTLSGSELVSHPLNHAETMKASYLIPTYSLNHLQKYSVIFHDHVIFERKYNTLIIVFWFTKFHLELSFILNRPKILESCLSYLLPSPSNFINNPRIILYFKNRRMHSWSGCSSHRRGAVTWKITRLFFSG